MVDRNSINSICLYNQHLGGKDRPSAGSYAPPVLKKKDEKAPMSILLHMYKLDRSAYDPFVPYLGKAGFAVLAIDMHGHGESSGTVGMINPENKRWFSSSQEAQDRGLRPPKQKSR